MSAICTDGPPFTSTRSARFSQLKLTDLLVATEELSAVLSGECEGGSCCGRRPIVFVASAFRRGGAKAFVINPGPLALNDVSAILAAVLQNGSPTCGDRTLLLRTYLREQFRARDQEHKRLPIGKLIDCKGLPEADPVPGRNVQETATWTMKTLAYHEGIPGHHFQISTALGLKGLPLVRQQTLYTAYTEGWALYAERFAAEIGMYKDDPLGDLGRLEAEMFRAARLVVDTGIHAQGWTREQAIAYMVDTTGMNESQVISEVERYMGQPGQACAYKIGQLKILDLRERAKKELGSQFNLKDFHTVVLENGGDCQKFCVSSHG